MCAGVLSPEEPAQAGADQIPAMLERVSVVEIKQEHAIWRRHWRWLHFPAGAATLEDGPKEVQERCATCAGVAHTSCPGSTGNWFRVLSSVKLPVASARRPVPPVMV
jgi:hypothetical protein